LLEEVLSVTIFTILTALAGGRVMRSLFAFRVNFAITFLGAFLLMFLIRLTALLPSQYYFSFSKLVAGDRGPFLVDPPSVTGAKLCELLRANGISPETMQSTSVDCRLVREQEEKRSRGPKFSAAAIDRIYGVALQSDAAVRDVLHRQLRAFSLKSPTDDELGEIIDRSKTVNDALEGLRSAYGRVFENTFLRPLGEAYKRQLSDVSPDSDVVGEPKEVELAIAPEDAEKIRTSNAAFVARFNNTKPEIALKPIQKSGVDEIVKDASGAWDLPNSLAKFYTAQIGNVANMQLRDAFAAHEIAPKEKEEARQLMFRRISVAGLGEYLIAVAIRLLPVVVFGVVLGFIFGRRELASIGLAAAVTAFLLSWPLILMWEKLVGYQWQAQRSLFMLFYTVYIFSFFVTARMSAVWGAGLRNLVSPLPLQGSIGQGETGVVTSREVVINILAGVITNAVVYGWNVLLPLMAA